MSRTRLAVATILATVCAGGAALAYWTAPGSGAGIATTGSATAVTLSPGSPDLHLYPGGQANVTLTVSNPNSIVVSFHSLALDLSQGSGGYGVDSGHSACPTSALSFTTQTNAGAGWNVPARTGSTDGALDVALPNALGLSVDAANACQGARFTVYLLAGS